MGIKFLCPECGKRINVKAHLAGKRGFCPKCNARVNIPPESQPATPGQPTTSPSPARTLPKPTMQAISGALFPESDFDAAAAAAAEVLGMSGPAAPQPASGPAPQPAGTNGAPATEQHQGAMPAAGLPSPTTTAAAQVATAQSLAPPSPAAPAPATTAPGTTPAMQPQLAQPAAYAAPANSPAPAAASVAADPIAEAPHLMWYVMPAGSSTPYGPANGEVLLQWIGQGRVAADSMVWRQDWSDWRPASTALPQLAPRHFTAPPPARPVVARAVAAQPAMATVVGAAPAAAGPWQSTPAPAGSSPQGGGVYYRRRSNVTSTVVLVVLIAIVAALAPFAYRVMQRAVSSSDTATPAVEAR